MTAAREPRRRIGRPPKVDEHGTPTRERLLCAAMDVCVEHGYEGVTLSEIARRADVSTPAVYSHFQNKAELLVAASRRELDEIGGRRLPDEFDLRSLARHWLGPQMQRTRIVVAELHRAAVRHPEVADLLGEWLLDSAARIQEAAGLSTSEIKMYYMILMGTTSLDSLHAVKVPQKQMEAEITRLVDGWLADRGL